MKSMKTRIIRIKKRVHAALPFALILSSMGLVQAAEAKTTLKILVDQVLSVKANCVNSVCNSMGEARVKARSVTIEQEGSGLSIPKVENSIIMLRLSDSCLDLAKLGLTAPQRSLVFRLEAQDQSVIWTALEPVISVSDGTCEIFPTTQD